MEESVFRKSAPTLYPADVQKRFAACFDSSTNSLSKQLMIHILHEIIKICFHSPVDWSSQNKQTKYSISLSEEQSALNPYGNNMEDVVEYEASHCFG